MAKITSFELFAVDLPFKQPFKHAAASRESSSSIFLRCRADDGTFGFGETLPRPYVTGETVDSVFALLHNVFLPQLLGKEFSSLDNVYRFLNQCDGKAPKEWINPSEPQTAAWCAVDLALLDTFGHVFNQPVWLGENRAFPENVRYSVVVSSDASLKTLLLIRLFSIPQVKIKVERNSPLQSARKIRTFLGKNCDIRADANMAWNVAESLVNMRDLSDFGIRSFEQPIAANDLAGLSRLVKESNLGVLVDESLNDRESLDLLINQKACTSVSVRIAKCGGLIAAYNRCRQALEAGLIVQVGCQVGESSLLSSANLKLITEVRQVTYAEGCFGRRLLQEDPGDPVLQFAYKGKPPRLPTDSGFGVTLDLECIRKYSSKSVTIE